MYKIKIKIIKYRSKHINIELIQNVFLISMMTTTYNNYNKSLKKTMNNPSKNITKHNKTINLIII